MMRASLSYALVGVLLTIAGCQKSDEPPKEAVTAKGGLMPVSTPAPRMPVSAVADQKQVKMIERTVSYEPLDTFIAKNAAAGEKAADAGKKKTASADKKAGKAKGEKAAAKSGEKEPAVKKGLFGRLKSGLGAKVGGLTQLGGVGGPGLPPDAAGKGGEKKDDAKAKKGEEDEGDEKAAADDDTDKEDGAKDADEEESDEDSADEDESDDEAEEDDSEDEGEDSDEDEKDDE